MAEGGEGNALVAADEYGLPDLLLQADDGRGQHGLGDEKVGGSLVDGARPRDFDDVF